MNGYRFCRGSGFARDTKGVKYVHRGLEGYGENICHKSSMPPFEEYRENSTIMEHTYVDQYGNVSYGT